MRKVQKCKSTCRKYKEDLDDGNVLHFDFCNVNIGMYISQCITDFVKLYIQNSLLHTNL